MGWLICKRPWGIGSLIMGPKNVILILLLTTNPALVLYYQIFFLTVFLVGQIKLDGKKINRLLIKSWRCKKIQQGVWGEGGLQAPGKSCIFGFENALEKLKLWPNFPVTIDVPLWFEDTVCMHTFPKGKFYLSELVFGKVWKQTNLEHRTLVSSTLISFCRSKFFGWSRIRLSLSCSEQRSCGYKNTLRPWGRGWEHSNHIVKVRVDGTC